MGAIELRDYQQRGVDALERLILAGKRRVLAVAPTGAGKGTMAAYMLAETAKAGGTGLFVVHRREILYDMHDRLKQLGVTAGIIMSDVKPNRTLPVQLASVQTLLHDSRRRMDVDLMIVDEAHHYAADEWRDVGHHVRPHATVGFTATPQRADGRPLGNMFDFLVDVVSYSELLERGDIVPCKVLRPVVPLGQDMADDAASAYLKYTPGTRAFVFTRGLAEAAACAAALEKAGVRARVVDTNTPDKEREETMRRMRQGYLDVIVNYYTMTEGIDIPTVTTVVLARSIQHEGAYMQMVGRALRAAPSKTSATVLDLCGASFTHGLPLDNRVYSLKSKGGMMKAGGDVREHKTRTRTPEETPDILHLELVEATEESQRLWGRRRIDWDAVGFGEKTDREIAKEFAIDVSTVVRIRKEKKLASVRKYHGTGINWSEVDLANKSDAQLARDLSVHTDTVRAARARLGITKAFRGRGNAIVDVDWDSEPLGKMADHELAKRHNVSSSTVFLQRTRRGIPPFQVQDLGIDWDAQPYGTMTDAELGRRLGVARKTVQRQREARQIPPFKTWGHLTAAQRAAIDWNQVDFTRPDGANADALGVSRWTVRSARVARGLPTPKRKSRGGRPSTVDWDAQPLGKEIDALLAKKLGVATSTVRGERLRRGIPSVLGVGRPRREQLSTLPRAPTEHEAREAERLKRKAHKGAVPKPSGRTRGYHAKIDWDSQPLGKKPDSDIARALQVDVSSVRDARVRRQVPAFSAGKAPKAQRR